MDAQSWFHEKATHFVVAQILFHLNKVGVVNELLSHGPLSSKDLSERLDLDGTILDVLMYYISNVDELIGLEDDKFFITDFGREVIDRFCRGEGQNEGHIINLFDVRVGCYGPVWSHLSQLLTGELVYGESVVRDGQYAEGAIYKFARHLYPSILESINVTNSKVAVEIGTNSGLLGRILADTKGIKCVGIDRNADAIKMESERTVGSDEVKWIHSNLIDVERWSQDMGTDQRDQYLFFSIHFHEFMAEGKDKISDALVKMRSQFSGSTVLVLEQPKPLPKDKGQMTTSLWRYSHSNILIHHLIGNGQILSDNEWKELFIEAGCSLVQVNPTNYLGYNAYLFRL